MGMVASVVYVAAGSPPKEWIATHVIQLPVAAVFVKLDISGLPFLDPVE